jgi:hypothetical protein
MAPVLRYPERIHPDKDINLDALILGASMAWIEEAHTDVFGEEHGQKFCSKWYRQLPDNYPHVSENQRTGTAYIGDREVATAFMLKNTMAKYVMEGGVSPWDEYCTSDMLDFQ